MTSARTFIALYPGADGRRAIERRIAELAAAVRRQDGGRGAAPAHPSLRPVAAHQAHLTLAFLGDLGPEELATVAGLVQGVAARHPPFEMSLARLGAFPDVRRPRVLWLGVEAGREALVGLATELRAELAAAFGSVGGASFHPHLTLARVRGEADAATVRRLGELIAASGTDPAGDPVGPPMRVDEIAVVASRLGPDGPRHTIRSRAPLARR